MYSRLATLFSLASFKYAGVAAFNHTNDLSWHAPNSTHINNLTSVINGEGIYGFEYDSSNPTDDGFVYGTYNWCNMPHVRSQEYKLPSDEYKLIYVELIHRHHKRTVYAANSFPVESYEWNCDDESLYYYGQTTSGNHSASTFWKQTTPGSELNPFIPSGFLGTCSFPQITAGGLDDSWQHGNDLYGVYHDLLNFLPTNVTDEVEFRVTQNSITSQVAGMVVNGMFDTTSDIPLHIQATGIDSLEPTYTCPVSTTIYANEKDTKLWNEHLVAAAPLYAALDSISGVPANDSAFHVSLDHYYDNLSARLCHAKPLPYKLVNGQNSSTCITRSMANQVFRLGQWEYSYLYRDAPTSLSAAVGSYGIFIAELTAHIKDMVAGRSGVIYRHNIAHDGSMARLLSVLQIEEMVWPGMGSEVVFEVWEKNGSFFVRVLWGGRVLQSSSPALGNMDMVPVQQVLAYFEDLVGVNGNKVQGICNGTI